MFDCDQSVWMHVLLQLPCRRTSFTSSMPWALRKMRRSKETAAIKNQKGLKSGASRTCQKKDKKGWLSQSIGAPRDTAWRPSSLLCIAGSHFNWYSRNIKPWVFRSSHYFFQFCLVPRLWQEYAALGPEQTEAVRCSQGKTSCRRCAVESWVKLRLSVFKN